MGVRRNREKLFKRFTARAKAMGSDVRFLALESIDGEFFVFFYTEKRKQRVLAAFRHIKAISDGLSDYDEHWLVDKIGGL